MTFPPDDRVTYAEALGVSPYLVRGRLPTFRPGKRWLLVRAQDVDKAQFGP